MKFNIKLFLNNSSLYAFIDGGAINATKQFNDDMTQISSWADQWFAYFEATISFLYSFQNRNLLKFNNASLGRATNHKHLGIETHSNLSWKDHILTISDNASEKVNVLIKTETFS